MKTKLGWVLGLVMWLGCVNQERTEGAGVGTSGEGTAGGSEEGAAGASAGAGAAGATPAGGGKTGSPAPGKGAPAEGGKRPERPGDGRQRPAPVVAENAYDGQGFVVHEWGTNTIVVGSDGSMQRGLHHEEEDLPDFVYDRLRGGVEAGGSSVKSVDVKMETPVTYFYSPQPLKAKVNIDFPFGVFTQWYPSVSSFYPPIFGKQGAEGLTYSDPVLDPHHPFGTQECKAQFGQVGQGNLHWSEVEVLGPGDEPGLPEAPLDRYTWSYARQVKANPVRVGAGSKAQSERFLFYRGLGNFGLPVRVTTAAGGAVTLLNTTKSAAGAAFVVRVGDGEGAFTTIPAGLVPGEQWSGQAPSGGEALAGYAAKLGDAVTAALDGTGLYHDEAVAMVNTWKRQWFGTPGLRAFYLLPQELTEAQIPLDITPKPDKVVRVMVIRVEMITPEQEQQDQEALAGGEAEAHFKALGRFAEPRLRRALAIAGKSGEGGALLDSLTSADTTGALGE